MAFTMAEIEKALTTTNNVTIGINTDLAQISQSRNYVPITDYLTGKTNSLPPMPDDHVYSWLGLINLLKDIEKPSANDHLALNVMRHPDLAPFINYFYSNWLLQYAFTHTGKSSLQAVISQLRAIGMKDDDIFGFFILHIGFDTTGKINIERTAIKEYLTDYIRKAKQLVYPRAGYLQWNDDWSQFYFTLLEEARPEFTTEYACYGVYSQRNNPVTFLAGYKNGKYIPPVITFIQDGQNADLRTIQGKFNAAIQLYEQAPQKYSAVAVQLSLQYLDYFNNNSKKDKWETGFRLQEFAETELSYIPYSSCAFHILLQRGEKKALQILTDWLNKKTFVSHRTLEIVQRHLGPDAFPYIELAINADNGGIDHYRLVIALLQNKFDSPQYLPLIWKLEGNKSRPLKELVAKIVAEKDPGAEARAIELLENKSADVRQTVALVLTQFSSAFANEAIIKTLNKEISDNARDILLQAVAGTLPANADENFVAVMLNAAKERGKLNKPVEAWLDENSLPSLYDHSGKQISNDRVRFLLYRMSRAKEMRSDIEAKYIIQDIDKEKAADFALELIKLYMEKNAKPEYKWLMALAALLGNDAVVDKIRITINRWMDENRYKMAEYGVGALALQGSDKALRWVEWYSRKYKSKKANVGAAALAALETAAEELGITIHELGDRVVPDFGFDGLFKHFTINGDEYRAFIDSNFKIAFFNENNKKLKSLPAAAGAGLKEEFKLIGKEVRDIVRSQSSRLEYYLIVQRRWSYEQWQKFFLQNPVMFIYATKLLWGVYDHNKLVQTFLCYEDTSLMDMNNAEISIGSSAVIGIVHPSQLDTSSLQQWKKIFFDLSVESIFPQLERRMPDMSCIDLSKSIITKFEGKQMVQGSIRNTLERYGWHKGPAGDGGMLDSFNLLYADGKMEAILEVEGIGAGYGWGGDEKTGRLYIIDKSKITQRWFNSPQNDKDDRLVKLIDVPFIFLSEMLAAVESIKVMEKTQVT